MNFGAQRLRKSNTSADTGATFMMAELLATPSRGKTGTPILVNGVRTRLVTGAVWA
jgi:hypothetical protein